MRNLPRQAFIEDENPAREEIKMLVEQVKILNHNVNQLQMEYKKCQGKLDEVIRQNKILTNQVQELLKENTALKKEVEEVTTKYRTLNQTAQGLENIANKAEADLAKCQGSCEKLLAENNRLRQNLTEAGVEQPSWWQVVALAIVGGVIGFLLGGVVGAAIGRSLGSICY